MKSLRIRERLNIIRDHLYSHVIFREELSRIDDKLLLLLDNKLEIKKLLPATGQLRLRQEICFQILRIVSRIAKKNGISFWLDYGTLLGAVRHQGFVPWDDDLDISMMMSDYVRFGDVLREQLPDELLLIEKTDLTGWDIGIMRIMEKSSGSYVDMYPYELIQGALNNSGRPTQWESKWLQAFREITRQGESDGFSPRIEKEIASWVERERQGDGDTDGIVPSMVNFTALSIYRKIHKKEDVFPLGAAIFEGESFPVPNDCPSILETIYGDYMRFPRDAGHSAHANSCTQRIDSRWLRQIIDNLTMIVQKLDGK